eukprot:CAMPEP_0118936896 /NCGR_PEP_ID=MMETSP1169-20130426/20928_1 /TAXON_ID=36882 /ORGANISM="Pyramimonas obovata, Strain CCMP722" /LENGTH=228 /DNA_ID=CAMNT_0006880345 /DNA_START=241 /DNA_END=924 /DNA_ORIENTATION=+
MGRSPWSAPCSFLVALFVQILHVGAITNLAIGDVWVPATVSRAEYHEFLIETVEVELPAYVRISVERQGCQADLYVSDNGVSPTREVHGWHSTNTIGNTETIILALERPEQELRASMHSTNFFDCQFNIMAESRPKATIELPYNNGFTSDTRPDFESGWLNLYYLSLPEEQLYYKVQFKLTAGAKVEARSRETMELRLAAAERTALNVLQNQPRFQVPAEQQVFGQGD